MTGLLLTLLTILGTLVATLNVWQTRGRIEASRLHVRVNGSRVARPPAE